MSNRDFVQSVLQSEELFFAQGPRADMIYLQWCGPEDIRIGWEVDPASIREHSWDTLQAVFTGKRSAEVMQKQTRIVGYYSNLRNWNPSKLAELRDRHRGNYEVH
jgi:hypothetical protein